MTKTIKLRCIGQTKMDSIQGGWGVIPIEPLNAGRPFAHLRTPSAVGAGVFATATQRLLEWTDKTDTAGPTTALSNRQPYGWDSWMAGGGEYEHWLVKGCRVTFNFLEGTQDQASTNNLIGGFTKTYTHDATGHHLDHGFPKIFANVDFDEPMDLINLKGFRPKPLADPGISTTARGSVFSYYFSLKKHIRAMKRIGNFPDDGISTFQGHLNTLPATRLYTNFVLMDRGNSPITGLDCIITMDYTIQLSSRILPNESVI